MARNWIYPLILALACGVFGKVLSTDEVHCQTCPKGYGMVRPCNTTANTICQECPKDSYSNVESAFEECRPCSLCGQGLYEMHPCTRTSDTFCELCSWQDAVPNEDYRRKCGDDSLINVIGNTQTDYEDDEHTDSVAWMLGGDSPKGDALNGHVPGGDSPKGDALNGHVPGRDSPKGDALNGHVPEAVAGNNGGDTEVPKPPAQPKDTPPQVDTGPKAAHQKHPSSDKNANKKEATGISIFSVAMVALAVGVVFFVVGFAVDRWRNGRKDPNNEYELAAETPSMPAQEMVYRTPIYTEKNGPIPATIHEESELDLTEVTPETLTTITEAQNKSQSPVNIDTDDVDPDVTLGNNPLLFKYPPASADLVNTGHTVRVKLDGQGSSLSGGPFLPKYELHHVDFKWGSTNEKGSEHTVDGVPVAAEVQLVHWNCKDYKSFDVAEKSEDGLAVLSVLLKVGQHEHEEIRKVTECLPSITFKGESLEFQTNEFDPASLLPASTSLYWTYIGSTTSLPYHESVTWVVFRDALEVTSEQLEEFRKLRPYHKDEKLLLRAPDNEFLVDNFRPVQPIGDRTIRASFV